MRTHDVQIPLPVYVRKKIPKPKHIATALSLTDRETVEAISITPSASTPSSRRKMSYAEEKTETAIRGTRQKQIRKSKKTQAEGKEEKVDITANASAKAVTLRKTPELKSAKEGSFLNTMYAKTMRRTADDKATAIEETPANILPPARISRDDEKIDSAPTAAKIYPVLRPVQESVYIGPGGTAAQMYTLVKPDQERPESRETAAKICTLVKPITCENEREEPRKENAQPTSEIIIPDAENVEKALTKANKLVRQFLTSPSPVDELHMRFRNAQQALQDAFDQAQLAIALTFAMQRVYNKMPSSLDATKILDHPISTPSPCSPRAKATDAAPTSDFILPDTASTARQFSKRESPPSNTVPLRLSPLVDLATTPLTVAAVNEKQQTGSQTEYARQVPKEEGPKEQNEQVPKEQVPKEQVIKEQVPKEQVPKEQVPKEQVPKEQVIKEQVPKEQVPKEQVPKETQYNKQSDKTSIYNTDLKVATPPNTDMTNKTDEEAPKTALPAPPVLETCTTVTAIPGPPVLETSVNVVSVAEQATTTNQSQPTSAKSPTTVETKTSTAKIGAVKAASTPKSENSVDDDDEDDEDSAQFVFVQSEWATAGQKKPIDEFCEPLGSESSASKSTNTAVSVSA
ncbi:unnamed protein product [Toxocara canis]|uniref:Titin n=1 Tax=Toxocara canis TaxID=6265 RepID=A0A183TWW3_TOXCA|nr:unnamed protein product [Toxocara canis]